MPNRDNQHLRTGLLAGEPPSDILVKGKFMPTELRPPSPGDFYPDLIEYLNARQAEFGLIPDDRKSELSEVAQYVRDRLARSEVAKVTFICTHNSRRSHLSQVWGQIAAEFYGLSNIETYSGGTEATAFNPRAVAALQRSGLKIVVDDPNARNPRYSVYTSDGSVPQVCFSKVYDAAPNPATEFCAVMTCAEADKACPLVGGCDLRVPIRYEDPKVADGTEQESQRYDERSAQICREMLFMMSRV
ncbi:MAG: protein-tyrosine-phosphatase [Pirellulaceae bacterium]